MIFILSDNGGVVVTRTESTSGLSGGAHHYKIYFMGDQLIGDVDEIVPEYLWWIWDVLVKWNHGS
jgi:hypothetical protein